MTKKNILFDVFRDGKSNVKKKKQGLYFTFMDLTMDISLGLRVLRAARAISKAGMASASSPSHSSFIALAASAALLATASSAATIYRSEKNAGINSVILQCFIINSKY